VIFLDFKSGIQINFQKTGEEIDMIINIVPSSMFDLPNILNAQLKYPLLSTLSSDIVLLNQNLLGPRQGSTVVIAMRNRGSTTATLSASLSITSSFIKYQSYAIR
jgi:hypothetical protein